MRIYFDSTDSTTDLEAVVDLVLSVLNERDDVKKGTLPDPLKLAGEIPADFIQPPIPTGQPEPVEVPTADTPPPPPVEVVTEAPPTPAPPAPVIETPLVKAPTKATGTNEVDASGCPWDERIHSGKKTTTEAGKWKRRRNIDDELYRAVMHEITDPKYDASAPKEPEAPAVPDPTTAGFGGNGKGIEWPDLVQIVMTAKLTDVISQEQVDKAVLGMGVEGGFNAMVSRPELYPQLMIELGL